MADEKGTGAGGPPPSAGSMSDVPIESTPDVAANATGPIPMKPPPQTEQTNVESNRTSTRREQQEETKRRDNPLVTFFKFILETIALIFTAIRALVFLFLRTIITIMPSAAMTTNADEDYSRQLAQQLKELVDHMSNLSELQVMVIKDHWIGQMTWTNSRATRERNANELIRWWQIILGVLIPVLTSVGAGLEPEAASVVSVAVSLIGIFVAVLTAIAQFRRPEERWRHYRIVTETYLNELWAYITLSGAYNQQKEDKKEKRFKNHGEAFIFFNERMNDIKKEDLSKFFGEVVGDSQAPSVEELRKLVNEIRSGNANLNNINNPNNA